ncbi:MAG: SRPBCC domain-containing protein [Chitinophagaceae bacterium]
MENYNSFTLEGNIAVHTRLLDAPRELVWEVWTNPIHIKEWWGPEGFSLTTRAMNVQPGDVWDFIMHGMGRDFVNKIEYTEVVKPSLLSYRHTGEAGEDYNFDVIVSFEDKQGKTLLTMKSVFKSREIIEELNRKVNASEAGMQTMSKLERYLNHIKNEKSQKK